MAVPPETSDRRCKDVPREPGALAESNGRLHILAPELGNCYEESAMPAATRKNQERIIANERKILRNQIRLVRILDNQNKILWNLQAMLKNQKKILANQTRILAK